MRRASRPTCCSSSAGKTDKGNTKAVWVYDMRANMPAFGKTRPLTVADFADFETAYGNDPNGGGKRKDQGEEGRWRGRTQSITPALYSTVA